MTGESSFMRLNQKVSGLAARLIYPCTLTQHRRWKDNTLPAMSSQWNSVNLMVSRMDRPGKRAVRAPNDQRVEDCGGSKCRAVIVRIGDNCSTRKGRRLPHGMEWRERMWNSLAGGKQVCNLTL